MTKSLIDFWKQWINYTGKTTRKEFWLTILDWIIILGLLFAGLSYLFINNSLNLTHVYWLWQIGTLIIWFPTLAIIWRRLNDLGFTFQTSNRIIWAWVIIAILTFLPYVEDLYILANISLIILCSFPSNHFEGK